MNNIKVQRTEMNVIKRDGSWSPYTEQLIAKALEKAGTSPGDALKIASEITKHLLFEDKYLIDIEEIQRLALKGLDFYGFHKQHAAYKMYMDERNSIRERGAALDRLLGSIIEHSDTDRNDNANINPDGPMAKMYQMGSRASREMYLYQMSKVFSKAHSSGGLHIHDLDFFKLTTTCVQIDLNKLFKKGFNTGHGHIRPPRRIGSFAGLACIAIQANQNDQHGGQSIPALDYYMAPGVEITFRKHLKRITYNLITLTAALKKYTLNRTVFRDLIVLDDITIGEDVLEQINGQFKIMLDKCSFLSEEELIIILKTAAEQAKELTEDDTFQAMEGIVFNLNTMHSRAGAQVPFSSVNYGTDTSYAGRLVTRCLLQALKNGMGNGETPIFPIHIFKMKRGINARPGDINYDLFQFATQVTSVRLFPNYSFLDSPFNLQYLKRADGAYVWQGMLEFYQRTQGFENERVLGGKAGIIKALVDFDQEVWERNKSEAFNLLEFYGSIGPDIGTEIAYMGCRTRVIGNVYDPEHEVVTGRGNLNFVTANLPRLAIQAKGDKDKFFKLLEDQLEIMRDITLCRMNILSNLKARHFSFLMGQGLWLDSEKLHREDFIKEVLKHGTLSLGFVGLAETLVILTGKHHGEDEDSARLGLEIVRFMRKYCDMESIRLGLNFTLLATPAESCAGRFLQLDRKEFGIIPKVTEHEYYTNSFHVPVYYLTDSYHKLSIEAPYHELCNAGHISYVECDGSVHQNPKAIQDLVQLMLKLGIGYGATNHPVDFDPICGYSGVIPTAVDNAGNLIPAICPQCGRTETQRDPFARIRRITGYLAGTIELFNPAKRAETLERVVHLGVESFEDGIR